MNVAERMGRLGTESAFEVLARARALERQGREVVHLEIGEPDFDTPAHIKEAAKRALDAGATHYGPSAGLPELREAIAKHIGETRGVPVSPEQVVVTPGAKPIMFFTILALIGRGDEVHLSQPGLSDLRVGHQLRRAACRCRSRCARRAGFGFDMALFEQRVSAEDQADHRQLAAEPDRRRAGSRPDRADRPASPPSADPRAHRRDLPAVPVRRRVRVVLRPARHARAVDPARRLLQDLRHDRLASRLRRDAGRSRRARDPADGELQLLHRLVRAAGRRGRAAAAIRRRSRGWWPSSSAAATSSSMG